MNESTDTYDCNNISTNIKSNFIEIHKKGLWHRTAHLWIYRKNKILVSKRSMKVTFPGVWDMAAGGHISSGESEISAVIREAKEEIGIELKPEEIVLGFIFKSDTNINGFINKEFDYVFFHETRKEIDDFSIDENETSEIKYIDIIEFEKDVKTKEVIKKYLPFEIEYYKKVLETLKKFT